MLGIGGYRRVMQGNYDSAVSGGVLRLEALQLFLQKCQLIIHDGIVAALRGDDPRPFQHITVESDDRDKGSIQGEIDCRLRHYAAHQTSAVGRRPRSRSAEISQERLECRHLRSRRPLAKNRTVMVPGNREDRAIVRPKGLIKLVVVILGFTEVIDHITQVKEKGGSFGSVAGQLCSHGIGDFCLVCDRLARGLLPVHFGGTGITDGMEIDLAGVLDVLNNFWSCEVSQIQIHGRILAGRRYGLHLAFMQQVIGRAVIGRASVVHAKAGFIFARLRLGKQPSSRTNQVWFCRHGFVSRAPRIPLGSRFLCGNCEKSKGPHSNGGRSPINVSDSARRAVQFAYFCRECLCVPIQDSFHYEIRVFVSIPIRHSLAVTWRGNGPRQIFMKSQFRDLLLVWATPAHLRAHRVPLHCWDSRLDRFHAVSESHAIQHGMNRRTKCPPTKTETRSSINLQPSPFMAARRKTPRPKPELCLFIRRLPMYSTMPITRPACLPCRNSGTSTRAS